MGDREARQAARRAGAQRLIDGSRDCLARAALSMRRQAGDTEDLAERTALHRLATIVEANLASLRAIPRVPGLPPLPAEDT